LRSARLVRLVRRARLARPDQEAVLVAAGIAVDLVAAALVGAPGACPGRWRRAAGARRPGVALAIALDIAVALLMLVRIAADRGPRGRAALGIAVLAKVTAVSREFALVGERLTWSDADVVRPEPLAPGVGAAWTAPLAHGGVMLDAVRPRRMGGWRGTGPGARTGVDRAVGRRRRPRLMGMGGDAAEGRQGSEAGGGDKNGAHSNFPAAAGRR